MTKKSFFKQRSVAQIRDMNLKITSTHKNLVKKILNLDPTNESLEIRTRITPGKFYINTESSAEASRKCYKHGKLISLSQPKTIETALECPDIPLAIRKRDFNKLKNMKEKEINFIGYSWKPLSGKDKRKRVVPFIWSMEAAKLYAYVENMAGGIYINFEASAKRIKEEGAEIMCTVPSRTKKKARYNIKLENVCVDGSTERRAIAWNLKSNFEIEPEHRSWSIRYPWEQSREGKDRFVFYPHDIAAYMKVISYFNEKHNLTPFEMSPLIIPSKKEAEFYKKLENNVIIYDPTTLNKSKTRKLHLDEKCILLARSINVLGHDETMFWDPARDGRLKDYNWKIK